MSDGRDAVGTIALPARSEPLRCVYLDLDGTLLGDGACLLRDGAGCFSLAGVRALQACHRARVEVVLFSGRRRAQVAEDARLIGASAYIYEVGCGLVIDGRQAPVSCSLGAGPRTIHDQIADTGAPQLLLERYAGRLEHHAPWHRDREATHLFRGAIDVPQANALLREHGLSSLRLIDNGSCAVPMNGLDAVHDYHLMPADVSKARAVRRHRHIRGYSRSQCMAVGDSREDLVAAQSVGTFWLVANALERDPSLKSALSAHRNVRVARRSHGAGVLEAVGAALTATRPADGLAPRVRGHTLVAQAVAPDSD